MKQHGWNHVWRPGLMKQGLLQGRFEMLAPSCMRFQVGNNVRTCRSKMSHCCMKESFAQHLTCINALKYFSTNLVKCRYQEQNNYHYSYASTTRAGQECFNKTVFHWKIPIHQNWSFSQAHTDFFLTELSSGKATQLQHGTGDQNYKAKKILSTLLMPLKNCVFVN